MDRINGADWVDIGGGRHGFRSQNAAAGVPGTEVTDVWLNNLQEEVAGIIEDAGLQLDEKTQNQLRKALVANVQSGKWVYAQDRAQSSTSSS
jgi:hypothetical protein